MNRCKTANIMRAGILWLCAGVGAAGARAEPPSLRIGWAQADITPSEPVLLAGQFHARVSEGTLDPVTATVLALECERSQTPLILVSCDLVAIRESVSEGVREILRRELPGVDPGAVLFHATHTHSAPYTATAARYRPDAPPIRHPYGIELPAMDPAEYVAWANRRIARAIREAWEARAPGGIAYGLTQAVVGRNRLMAYANGRSRMYGRTDTEDFSHVEGYEDPALHVLATYDAERRLTGLVLNLACPSQASEHIYRVSADFWHDARVELRERLGESLFVLPQHRAAGDQSPRVLLQRAAEARMLYLRGHIDARPDASFRGRLGDGAWRRELGRRIADASVEVLPFIGKEIDFHPDLRHRVETVELPRRRIPESDRDEAVMQAAAGRERFETLRSELEADPARRTGARWYHDVSRAYRLWRRHERVVERYERQQTEPVLPFEMHVARLGDVAFAANPFELYLDFGIRIQERSPAMQTFIVQLAGPGSYLPTERSVVGGAYGAVPASTEVGPDSGHIWVERTLELLDALFPPYEEADIRGSISLPRTWRVFVPAAREAPPLSSGTLAGLPDEIRVEEETLAPHEVEPEDGAFDFSQLFGGVEPGRTAYVFVPLESAGEQVATFGFGADWWMQAWMNGEPILDTTERGNESWPPTVADHRVQARLRPGVNILSVRFVGGSGSSVLAMAGPDRLRARLRE